MDNTPEEKERAYLKNIKVKGFKSIREMDLNLNPLNVMIGANGSGKSNFLSLFTFFHHLSRRQLTNYVRLNEGGAYRLLHFPSETDEMNVTFNFDAISYFCSFTRGSDDILYLGDEHLIGGKIRIDLQGTHHHTVHESNLNSLKHDSLPVELVTDNMNNWRVYHFFNTSSESKSSNQVDKMDYAYLKIDASNLASVLNVIQEKAPKNYNDIIETIKLVAPFFVGFSFQVDPYKSESQFLQFRWRHKDCFDDLLPSQMSDGTLRFICLVVLLLQPYPPPLILIDEPELGLHPLALSILAEIIQGAVAKTQIIIATQSATFVDHFAPEDIIVVDRKGEESVFTRQSTEDLKTWLEEFSLGELWEKNVIGGRP